MTRDEFKKLYPYIENNDSYILSKKIILQDETHAIIEEVIDLNHPECPIIKFEKLDNE